MTAQAHAISIAPGTRLAGFDILSLRCAGTVSDVWVATTAVPASRFDPSTTTAKVAIKALRPPFSRDGKHRERMAREIAVHAQLSHPNIVRFVDGSPAEGFDYLAVEYVEGMTLRELLAARGCPVPLGVALNLAASLCDALDYVHEQRGAGGALGLVHGAVSPENVMVDRSGAVKLLDFGETVATLGVRSSLRRAAFPETSVLASRGERYLRQLQYVAPEQLEGKGVDRRSDVYAVGSVLFELLTGAPPFDANELSELAGQIATGDGRALDEEFEAPIAALVTQAMHVDPNARVETARELAEKMRAISGLYEGGTAAVARCVQQAIGLGVPVLELEEAPPDTLRPGPGTELDHIVHDLVLATSSEEEALPSAPAGKRAPAAPPPEADHAGRPRLSPDVFTRTTRPALRAPDVFRSFARELNYAEHAEHEPPPPSARDPNSLTAAVEFERGWRALREGRRWEALAAWETAQMLDPDNATYALDVRHLREKLLLH